MGLLDELFDMSRGYALDFNNRTISSAGARLSLDAIQRVAREEGA